MRRPFFKTETGSGSDQNIRILLGPDPQPCLYEWGWTGKGRAVGSCRSVLNGSGEEY